MDSFIIYSLFGQFGFREEEEDRIHRVEDDYSKSSEESSTCEGVLFSRRNKKSRTIADSDDEVSLDSSYNYNQETGEAGKRGTLRCGYKSLSDHSGTIIWVYVNWISSAVK